MFIYCSQGHQNPEENNVCQYCGERMEKAIATLAAGTILGERYRIVKQLSNSNFGATYLAEDLHRFDEKCILKEFAPQIYENQALLQTQELFSREAGILYKLYHPQIPNFREIFHIENISNHGRLFLVQDYIEGDTYQSLLEHRSKQGIRFSEREVKELLLKILPVLAYIHGLGVIHGNISPGSIIFKTSEQLPVLIDFGGVKQIAAILTAQFNQTEPEIIGRIGYTPPEQIEKGIIAQNSDLYALAATAIALLTGKEIQNLMNMETMKFTWREEVNVSETLGEILDKMLAKIPGDRFQNASEVMAVLKTISTSVEEGNTRRVSYSKVAIVSPTQVLFKTLIIILLFVGTAISSLWLGFKIVEWTKIGEKFTQQKDNTSENSPVNIKPKSPYSSQETKRKESLIQKAKDLEVRQKFLTQLVDDIFWLKNPNLAKRTLTDRQEDEQLREKYDQITADLLDNISAANLSVEVRQRLGRYKLSQEELWLKEVSKLSISSNTIKDLTNAKFASLPQDYSSGSLNISFDEFIEKPMGQIWLGIMYEQIIRLKEGKNLENVVFPPGNVTTEFSGDLERGDGKVLITRFVKGKTIEVKLDATGDSLLSIYRLGEGEPILQNSREKAWTGILQNTGYYQFVIRGDRQKRINYNLTITKS